MKKFYEAANLTLYLGDCIEILNTLAPKSVDMIFADPPYMLSNGGITCQSGKISKVNKAKWDESNGFLNDFNFHKTWIESCKEVLKENGTIWISGTYHSIYTCGYILQKSGFKILNDICWFKSNAPPNMSCRYFAASHETLIWAKINNKEKHTFNYKVMKELTCNGDFIKSPGKQMRTVWAISSPKPSEKKFGKHPTQKPVELLKRIILASTNKNDLILDPFTGSSTTGLMAAEFDRKFIGIDSNEEYLTLSVNRLKDKLKDKKNE